jgi:hypothetical protein
MGLHVVESLTPGFKQLVCKATCLESWVKLVPLVDLPPSLFQKGVRLLFTTGMILVFAHPNPPNKTS